MHDAQSPDPRPSRRKVRPQSLPQPPTTPHPTAARVLEAALRIVGDEGEQALTLRRLTDESGVSAGTIYHHTRDLAELVRRVREAALADWASAFLSALVEGDLVLAYRADGQWREDHPGLIDVLDKGEQRKQLEREVIAFSPTLRAWLNSRRLVVEMPLGVVTAVLLGPLFELRRAERALGRPVPPEDLSLAARIAWLAFASSGSVRRVDELDLRDGAPRPVPPAQVPRRSRP